MPSQNLISAILTNETKGEVLKALGDIKSKLDFLLSLQSNDIQSIFKPGAGYLPFIDLALTVVDEHPEILPSVFNTEEFKKDYALAKQLAPIVLAANELIEGLQKTYTAVNSDAMAAGFDVYAAVKQNKDKVPGLKVIADQMGAFFQRSPRKSAPATQAAPPVK